MIFNFIDFKVYEHEMKNYEMMLNEFYDQNSSNNVKLCLQKEFDKFGERDKCWVQCCYNLENSKNQYLLMFSLNIMEVKLYDFIFKYEFNLYDIFCI